MTKYVIDPELRLARENVVLPLEHQRLTPTLLRFQLLALLYRMVHNGEMTEPEAKEHLDYIRWTSSSRLTPKIS